MGLVALALYVHWPWCVHKCPYCDFNSRSGLFRIDETRYIAALLADLGQAARDLQRPVTSVFFGGGTPSLMSEEGFDALMRGIRERVLLADDAEVTLENPVSTASHWVCKVLTRKRLLSSGAFIRPLRRVKPLGGLKTRSPMSTLT